MFKAKVFSGVGQVVVIDGKSGDEFSEHGIGKKVIGIGEASGGLVVVLADIKAVISSRALSEISDWTTSTFKNYAFHFSTL